MGKFALTDFGMRSGPIMNRVKQHALVIFVVVVNRKYLGNSCVCLCLLKHSVYHWHLINK